MEQSIEILEGLVDKIKEDEVKKIIIRCFEKYQEKNPSALAVYKNEFIIAISGYLERKGVISLKKYIIDYINKKIPDHNSSGLNKSQLKKFNIILCISEIILKRENMDTSYKVNFLIELILLLSDKSNNIFTDFAYLLEILDDFGIQSKKVMSIIVNILRKNTYLFETLPISEILVIDEEKLRNHKFHFIYKGCFNYLLNNYLIYDFLRGDEQIFKNGAKKIIEFVIHNRLDLTDIKANTLKIKEFNEKIIANASDNDEVIESLKKCFKSLGLEKFSYGIINYFISEDKRNKSLLEEKQIEGDKKVLNISNDNKQTIKLSINKRKNNLVYREVEKYINLDTLKVQEDITLEEIIYVLSLLYSIDMKDEVIDKILLVMMQKFEKNNPVSIYYQSLGKLAYFKDKYLIDKYLDDISLVFSDILSENQSIFICNDDEYVAVKELLSENMNAIMLILYGDHSYEKEKAKELLKNEEK